MWEKIKEFFSPSKKDEWSNLTEKEKELFFKGRKEYEKNKVLIYVTHYKK